MLFLKTFEKFDKVAFHGFGMRPEQMRLSDCNTEWTGPDQDTGCPLFSSDDKLSEDDINKALLYLNEENIKTLIAYSRGGAILLEVLKRGAKLPKKIFFVAPAWNRKWAKIIPEPIESEVYIIHGGKDNQVPLKHSIILSEKIGAPLYVSVESDHISILKHKDDLSQLKLITNITEAKKILPDWGRESLSTEEELKLQYEFCLNY